MPYPAKPETPGADRASSFVIRHFPRTAFALVALLASCHKTPPPAPGPLPQRGYLWQRDWNPAVADAAVEADGKMDGLVVLGAEIVWDAGKARVIEANIPWDAVRSLKKKLAVALRVAPYPGPFAADDAAARRIISEAKALLAQARAHGVELSEFQFDFDCAQKNLAGYRVWLGALREAVRPVRFVITTLPSWLDRAEFPALVREADGYVLQVHSVPTVEETGRATLCDPALARKWVAKAVKLGLPFSVALPTYRCAAGYDAKEKLLGVVMDSVQQAWPPGTHVLEFGTDADAMAGLVCEWQAQRPAGMLGLLWYRVPVATDQYNWRWPTLSAVMAGRNPAHKLEVVCDGGNPADIALLNNGEAEEPLRCTVIVTWKGAAPVASDALRGWAVRVEAGRAVLTPEAGGSAGLAALSPGGRRDIGWLRYETSTPLHFELTEQDQPAR